MKKLFAIVLLVSAMAVIGCGEKKAATKTAPPAPPKIEEKKTEAAPAPPAAAPAGEKK